MKHTIRVFFMLMALMMGATSESWAQESELKASDIVIDDGIEHGTVAVKSVDNATRTVTITVDPDDGYYIQKSDIMVQKLVDPAANAPRRAIFIADPLIITSGPTKSKTSADYTFVVPADYAGALVTATFRELMAATVPVKPNPLVYTGSEQELVTLGKVVGTKFNDGAVLEENTSLAGYYTKSGDIYTPCSADGQADGTTTYYKPLVTYSNAENGTYSDAITTGTNAGTYTVYYKYVADVDHADGSGSVTVVINKAPITSVELNQYVQKYNEGNAVAFSITSVKAGDLTVSPSDYDVSGDDLTAQTSVGTYTCTITAKSTSANFTGSASVNFRIVEATTIFVNSSTDASDITDMADKMAGKYVLTSDISASKLAGLYSTSEDFTGELDGNFHKITGLSGHGLFNTISGDGKVKNVILEDVNITTGDPTNGDAGAICNIAKGSTRIYNCGILSTDVVYDDDGNVETINATSGSKVSGTRYVGGLVGLLDGSARVINCYSYASITGGTHRAGIVGYNNHASKYNDLKTMVMNCMFYGDISTGGTEIVPIYGGEEISNESDSRLNNYNYFVYEAPFSVNNSTTNPIITKYNRALAAEERYLVRFEFYRNLVNSTRELASWYVFGSVQTDAHEKIAKWVLDQSIAPYPILKPQGYYPSVVNYDPDNTYDKDRNKISRHSISERAHGKHLGTLSVTISMPDTQTGGQGKPTGASLNKTSITLNRIDKDTLNYNFNYDKVQLPYYNDVGTGNYTKNKVVTGWMVTSITAVTDDPYTSSYYTGDNYDSPYYNFADRKSSNKDKYSISGRVFSQGAYFDVPDGVTSITIEPYWGNAAYLSDEGYDAYYTQSNDSWKRYNVNSTASIFGQRYTNATSTFNGDQPVYTSFPNALARLDALGRTESTTVYDYAVVLVGNYHHKGMPEENGQNDATKKHFTVMSVDFNYDNEPDYSLIIHSGKQEQICPIRFDFINVPGAAMAHKITSYTYMGILGNLKFRGWFETTNTTTIHFSQFEYDGPKKILMEPLILMGGIVDMFTSSNSGAPAKTKYIHVGSNVYFKVFNNGVHMDQNVATPHRPISVTGGDYKKFYLSGYLKAAASPYSTEDGGKNAECYISGGRFGEVAGAGYEQINGNVTWQIYYADVQSFYGGGINEHKAITGNISTTIRDSYVKLFCGGPKFGNMSAEKTVITNATDCTFDKFFGAGYGGTAITRVNAYNKYQTLNYNWNGNTEKEDITPKFSSSSGSHKRGKYVSGQGISINYDYENFEGSSVNTVGYLFVNYASLSVAQTNGVTSTLSGCTINEDFYGGGSLGAVVGDATSTLTNCTVLGSAYGAGYSASVPTASVFPAQGFKEPVPFYNSTTGVFEPGGGYPDAVKYTWSNDEGSNTNTLVDKDDGTHYIHVDKTAVDLSALGTVTGKVTLNIEGTTTVAGSVYGGGEESAVDGSTEVNVTSGTIGSEGNGGVNFGNVYGGGKGKNDDVKAGLVKGNTKVRISQAEGKTTRVYHNVYGGGAYGSVGTFTYDTNNVITGHTENTGKTEVIITGGTFGWNGKENGMVFGSSRGDVGAPNAIEDKMAWVYDTEVKIGTPGQGSNAPQPQIKGSVYGGGENGHNYNNADVYIYSGTIGIAEGAVITDDNGTPDNTDDDETYDGAAYQYRGNVYGGGCGTDKYYSNTENVANPYDGNGDKYNPKAGIVRGDATVTISGGHVVRNVYGAGAMGSVGTADVVNSGHTTINISGGTIGVNGSATVGDGNVFGAARGSAEATSNEYALVRNTTTVNISGKASVKGNVYGGGELGCVGRYVISSDMRNFYWTDNPATNDYNNTGVCNVNITGGTIGHHVFGGGRGKADTFWCEKGIAYKTNVSITDGTVNGDVYGGGEVGRVEADATVKIGPDTGIGSPDINGNVFGAGDGVKTHGYSALVRGNTYVTIQGSAKVGECVYGGGNIAAVGKYYLVDEAYKEAHPESQLEIGMPYSLVSDDLGICNVNVKGKAQIGYKGIGHVFGAGKGKEPEYYTDTDSYETTAEMPKRMMSYNEALYKDDNSDIWEFSDASEKYVWEYFDTKAKYLTFLETLGLVTRADLTIGGEATVSGNVYGGSESGFVQHSVQVKLKESCVIGTTSTGGNVFGGGLGLANFSEAGRVRGNTNVTIEGGTARGNVYGGGSLGDVGTINKADIRNYIWTDQEGNPNTPANTNDSNTGVCNVTISGGTIGIDNPGNPDEHGNVFGAGMGLANNFWCEKAMVYSANVSIKNSGTVVKGCVFGGGQIGRVEDDTKVEIGTESGTDAPEITGNVFGAGKGLKTHGYSALVRGNVEVTVQGGAKVGESVYGGGEIASVGRYKVKEAANVPEGAPDWVLVGMPYSLANDGSGKCTVIVRDNAEIGPDNMQMTTTGGPDDSGHVFGAGMGVLPYEGVVGGEAGDPWRVAPGDIEEHFTDAYYKQTYGESYKSEGYDYKVDYFKFIETLALANETDVTIDGNAFIKGSVYGGSMNGHVQHDTKVTIQGGQIGAGNGMTERYQETDWTGSTTPVGGWKECAHWDYKDNGAPYDLYATYSKTVDGKVKYYYDAACTETEYAEGGAKVATDGHTYYGNVYGGGSGVIPYAPGKWHRGAGSVGGNIQVDITGGHILTNVYGGNEQTDVGTYTKDSNGLSTATPVLSDPKGECVINITGGTVGVPRNDDGIKALPTIGHLYGGGKGDKRIFFNTWTNVISTKVNISGNARIYGSTFGGGEDGHVLGNAVTTINGADLVIGCDGTSGYDGNVFGGGQGSSTALTAGVVGGNVTLNIQNGTMKGSVYGGGRIASVGTYFAMVKIPDPEDPTKEIDNPLYGKMQDGDHGVIKVNLTGGIISHNVFGGGMGTTDNTYGTKDGLAISKDVTVELNKGVDVDAKGCVVKGFIFGCNNVNSTPQGHAKVHIHATQNENEEKIGAKNDDVYDVKGVFGGGNRADYVPEDATQSTEVIIEGCDLTSIDEVYGGGYGAATPATKVLVRGTKIINNVFGGGYGAGSSDPTAANYNPGANVGFYTSSTNVSDYPGASGKAVVELLAGHIKNVYGGSNTKGDIKGGSSITNKTKGEGDVGPACCDALDVQNIYGGGKDAEMEGGADIVLGCMPNDWIAEIYAGAENADVGNDVSLTLTSGKFGRVFGGNKSGGRLHGGITLNIEENGACGTPIIIGELYGGGNEAPYSIYGYKNEKDANDKWIPRQKADYDAMTADEKAAEGMASGHHEHPQVNVRAFTSIGNIYGGGLGETAVMVGDPTVNINEVTITHTDTDTEFEGNAYNPANDNQEQKPSWIGDGAGKVKLYPHENGKMGVIGNVFGGGNAAKVIGNTTVNIGTKTEVPFESLRTNLGVPKKPVVGADIRGNVYGGGNQADVTGDTNVNIGKKAN